MGVNLVLFKKSGSQRSFALPSSVTVIGRRSNCDLHIPLMSVSRKHCQLNHHQGVLRVRDLGSRNGTYLNGKRIDEAEIKAGDSIKVGPLTFVLQINGKPRDINAPKSVMRKSPQKKEPTDDLTAKEVETFAELDELDDFDFLEEDGSA